MHQSSNKNNLIQPNTTLRIINNLIMKVRKTHEGGWIVLTFSSPKTEITV